MSTQEKVFNYLLFFDNLQFVLLNKKILYLEKIIKNIAKNFFQE